MNLHGYIPYLRPIFVAICVTGFVIGVVMGIYARFNDPARPKYKVGLKVGSKTILYDPDLPPDQIVGLFDEAFGTHASNNKNQK